MFGTSAQKYKKRKNRYKVFRFGVTLFDFLHLHEIFCTELSVVTNTNLQLALVSFSFHYFEIYCNFRVYLKTLREKICSRDAKKGSQLEVLYDRA